MKNISEPQIEKMLKRLALESRPDKDFDRMLQFKLRDKFTELYAEKEEPYHKGSSFFGHLLKLKLRFVTATVLLLFTSTTIYAYNSDSITNGDLLYPLKLSVEKVEVIFARTPERKIDYYNKMAKRRIRELDTLEKRGRIDEETVVEAERLLTIAENTYIEISEPSIINSTPIEIPIEIRDSEKNAIIESVQYERTLPIKRPRNIIKENSETQKTRPNIIPIKPKATTTENDASDFTPSAIQTVPKAAIPENVVSDFAANTRKEQQKTELLNTREEFEADFNANLL